MSKFFDKILLGTILIVNLILLFIPCFIIAATYLLIYVLLNKLNLKETSKLNMNVAIAFDQLANALTGGDADETVSSRSGKLQGKRKWACLLCTVLNIFDTGHCKKSVETDEGKDSVVE